MVARTAEADIQDVTPEKAPASVTRSVRASAPEERERTLTPEWRPEPGEVFAANDASLRAILGRSYQNAERGLPDYDPLLNLRVWWRPNGRGGHVAQIRPVADREKAMETGEYDYWSVERNCWVRNGRKAEADHASFRTDNEFEE